MRPPSHASRSGISLGLSLSAGVIVGVSSLGLPFVLVIPPGWLLIFIVSGLLIVVAAALMRVDPQRHVAWGAVVIAFSLVSFLQSPPLLYYRPLWGIAVVVGVALGVAGGVLGITTRTNEG